MGRPLTEVAKAKISQKMMGRKFTAERLTNMKIAVRKRAKRGDARWPTRWKARAQSERVPCGQAEVIRLMWSDHSTNAALFSSP